MGEELQQPLHEGPPQDPTDARHISGMTTSVIVRWVRNQLGEDGVRRMLVHAHDPRPAIQIEDTQGWSSYWQATALLEAAVAVTGRPDAARCIGEEMLTQHRGTPVIELLQSLGSPEALLESIAASGAKFSSVLHLHPLEVTPGRATVAGTTAPGIPRHRLLCDFTAGILSVVPSIFGMDPAAVAESDCQARGGTECTYHLTWDPASSPDVGDPVRRIHYLEEELAGARRRLTALQNTASEVVTASDVSSALAAVARRAGQAVGASAYLLAVRVRPASAPTLHGCGLDAAERDRLAGELLGTDAGGRLDDGGGQRIIVDVRSGERLYGRFAALYPEGTKFFPHERDLLRAYAGHAAALLDTAAALEEARAQNRTSRALLDLSAALSRVGSREEVSQRLASAVPEIVECDRASVLLWDEEGQRLLLTAWHGDGTAIREKLRDVGIGTEATPVLVSLLANREPLFLTVDTEDPYIAELLRGGDAAAVVVVPIVGHDRFYGVVTAEVTDDPDRLHPDDDLLERIAGIAHHGATALESAKLLEQLRMQALHDPLTGRPNRALLVDRIEHALAAAPRDNASVALMFLDLDRFKEINDVFGHAAGDVLLVQVAGRLAATVRDGDTVARLGGDEFAVLLPQVRDEREAVGCAERVLTALEPAFVIEDIEFTVSASIGIGLSYGPDTEALALLREADRAMYAAKARGGGVYELAAPIDPTTTHRLLLDATLRAERQWSALPGIPAPLQPPAYLIG
jgi:diguanylate cyclase (GGDEF)-like protein